MACSSGAEKDSDLFFCLFEKCLYKCLFDMRRDEPDDELLIIESRHGPVETVFHKEVVTGTRGPFYSTDQICEFLYCNGRKPF